MPRQKIKDEDKYIIDKKTGCWNWIKSIGNDGYAIQRFRNKDDIKKYGCKGTHAHRYIYKKYVKDIPKTLVLDHLCKNIKCVNPEHMEITTQKKNIRRSNVTKVSYNDISLIKNLYKKGYTQRELALLFKINQSQVSRLINGLRGLK